MDGNKPIRIQRKRTKGWKMPENTVYVGRPTKWGNPFKISGDMIYVDASHRRKILSPWVLFYQDGGHTPEEVARIFREMMFNLNSYDVEDAIYQRFRLMRDTIRDLEGKNLACFCKEGEPCHADVLLELANQ
jgi:hypothetical protein